MLLNPTVADEIITRQEHEIAEAKWHDLDEILVSDEIHDHNKNFIREALKCR